ncbi:MAG: chain-length determining protein [Bacteroidaceae bacterium]|nr:chain-length determining protein [Bacteroidaceae bacterium]
MSNKKERSFIDILMLLWANRKLLLKACVIGGVLSIIIAFSIPKQYTSSVVLAPELSSSSGITGSIGSLASMAGIDLGGLSGTEDALYPELYPQIVESTPFLCELMDLPVETKDGKLKTDLYHYLRYKQKYPWWTWAIQAPVRLVKKLTTHNVDTVMPTAQNSNSLVLTRSQQGVLKSLSNKVKVDVDKGNNVITLNVIMQDPLIAATVAQEVSEKLQQYVADYRTAKARKDLAYTTQLYDEAQKRYFEAQKVYATFVDQHQGLVKMQYQIEQDRLENEKDLAFGVYNQISSQLELSKAKVQEKTPVCVVMQPPYTPFKASSPKKMMMGIMYVFLAFFGTAAWIVIKELIDDAKETK